MKKNLSKLSLFLVSTLALTGLANAQDRADIRWKSESQVRSILGEPSSTTTPIGTHASYTLWKYDGYVVAFANNMAFHLFHTGASSDMQLDEKRTSDSESDL